MQSRASRVREVLTSGEVNEMADAPAGVVNDTVREIKEGKSDGARMGVEGATPSASPAVPPGQQAMPKLNVASVSKDGKVTFEAVQESEKKQ